MPPAARVSDQTAHGTPLAGAGSATVLIGGLPAWRATADVHACPVSTPNPHVGGPVQLGSATVLIDGMPAARLGDVVVESGGPPNAIVGGCTTVMIG